MAAQLHHQEQLNGQIQPRHQSPASSLQGYSLPEKREPGGELLTPTANGVNPYFQPAEPSVAIGPPPTKKRAIGPSVRTGQACDRCKNRKIRCDPNADGCSPCRQNNTECKTTDRITGRASVRGHAENLERDNVVMRQHIADLERQIKELGFEPKPLPPYLPSPAESEAWRRGSEANRGHDLKEPTSPATRSENSAACVPPSFTSSGAADLYLGVSPWDGKGLSEVKGMSMSLFGVQFDIGEYITAETDERVKLMSAESSLDSIFAIARSGKKLIAELPKTLEECLNYAHWYFMAFNAYFPILHRPAFLDIISRIYNENYEPTVPETVTLHIVLACMKLQYAMKIEDKEVGTPVLREALAHYHFALTYWKELMTTRTMEDLKALTVMAVFMRFFPSPENAWSVSNTIFSVVIERGYHRRPPKPWDASTPKDEILRQETRKRIFYTLIILLVKLSGRIGRPMPLKRADYDVELPEYLNDDLQKAEPGHEPDQCGYYIAILLAQEGELFLEMFSTVYAVKPTIDYDEGVKVLKQKIDRWTDNLPSIVNAKALSSNTLVGMAQIHALWLSYAHYDFIIKLHHPALCRSQNPEIINRNIDICVQASEKVLDILMKTWELQSTDATWMVITDAAAAIFTLVYALWERRDQTSMDDLLKLKHKIETVMPCVGQLARMFGAGAGFRENLQKIIDSSLGNISRFHTEKTASAAAAAINASTSQATPRSPHMAQDTRARAPSAYVNPSHSYTIPAGSQQNHQHPPNPNLHDLSSTSLSHARLSHDHSAADYSKQYHATPTSAVHHYAYDSFPTNVASDAYAMLHNQHQQHHFNGYGVSHDPIYAQDAWRQWAESMRDYPAPPQDYMSSANALVALGGGGVGNQHAGAEQNGFGVGVGLGVGGGVGMAGNGVGAVGMGGEAGAFPSMIPDATMHAAFAAQGWGVGQGHGHGQGHQGHGQGHGHNGHNGHGGQGH